MARRFLLLVVVALCGVRSVAMPTSSPQTAPPVPVLVELFTSEGCSSCPPADDLLRDLIARQPVKEALVIGLSEHVDYWDQLGWKDPFSHADFTHRQQTYAAAARSSEVYTPEIFVDGADPVVGSDRNAVFAAIKRAAAKRKTPIQLAWSAAAPLTLEIALGPDQDASQAKIFLAIAEDRLQSSVKRGENAGRRLEHSGVTRRLSQIGTAGRDGHFSATVPIAIDPSWNRTALRVAVFAERRAPGAAVAAATIAIRP